MLLLNWIGSRAEGGGNKYRQVLTKFGNIPTFAMPANCRIINVQMLPRLYLAPLRSLMTEYAVARCDAFSFDWNGSVEIEGQHAANVPIDERLSSKVGETVDERR
jgi:hypothetical protein